MEKAKRASLEAAGFWLGDAEDFLGLTESERRFVELRVTLSRAIRQLREKNQLTQAELARRIGSTQPRVARIEAAAPDVALDLMFRGLFALGGTVADVVSVQETVRTPKPKRKRQPAE